MRFFWCFSGASACAGVLCGLLLSQEVQPQPKGENILPQRPPEGAPQFPGGPPFGFGPPRGPPGGEERRVVAEFDQDGDGRLNRSERDAARAKMPPRRGPGGPPGGGPPNGGPPGEGPPRGGFGGGPGRPGGPPRPNRPPAKPGKQVRVEELPTAPESVSLYDPQTLRGFALQFEQDDWEAELDAFYNTDVEVPATLIVDGRTYREVGVHFRGASSFFTVGSGYKRSLNLSLDFVHKEQRLYGYKTLNLLNGHEDDSLIRAVLYLNLARKHIPAPKANFVTLAINGENWGVYTNVQQFDKQFLKENYPSSKGVRWKTPGSPQGRAGLQYLGDNLDVYKRSYEMKTDDGEQAWKDLARLCQTLTETPLDQLEAKLEPLLDLEGALWFLALENVFINGDGYWVRASDYSLFRDDKGKFHIIPHDANETFRPPHGPPGGMGGPLAALGGMFGFGPPGRGPPGEQPPRDRPPPPPGRPGEPSGPGGAGVGVKLDPLVGLDDAGKPLRSRLLAVPSLRKRYLEMVRQLAEELDWNQLGPTVQAYRQLIERAVQDDTRKLSSNEAFLRSFSVGEAAKPAEGPKGPPEEGALRMGFGPPPAPPLAQFCKERREFLLGCPAIQELLHKEPSQ